MAVRGIILLCSLLLACGVASAARVLVFTIDQTPGEVGLRELSGALAPDGGAASAIMVARTAQASRLAACRGDGYLTINAGVPAMLQSTAPVLISHLQVDPVVFKRDARRVPANAGAFGAVLRRHGMRTGAIGSPESLLLVMDHAGEVDAGDPRPLAATQADLVRARALVDSVDVACVDVTRIAHRDRETAWQWMRALLEGMPSSTVVIACSPNAPLIDSRMSWPTTWAVRIAPATKDSAWYSPATRRAGIITSLDLATTMLAELGVQDTAIGYGRVAVPRGYITPDALLAQEGALYLRAAWRPILYLPLIIVLAVIMGALALTLLLGYQRSHPVCSHIAGRIAVVVPTIWLVYAMTGFWPTSVSALLVECALGCLLAAFIIWRTGSYRVIALWIAAGVLVLVGACGSPHWTLYNQTSFLVQYGARFYGLGNATAGLLVAAMLASGTVGMGHSIRAWRAAAVGVLTVLAGWILWTEGGANFGMGLTAMLMVIVFALNATPSKRRRWWVGICMVAIVLGVGGLLWYDTMSGAQSHMARLVQDVGQHGLAPLGQVAQRKLLMAWKLLRSSDWVYVLAGGALAAGAWWMTAESSLRQLPAVRRLCAAGSVAILLALGLNDSGVEPAGILIVCLVTCLVSARTWAAPCVAPVLQDYFPVVDRSVDERA